MQDRAESVSLQKNTNRLRSLSEMLEDRAELASSFREDPVRVMLPDLK